MDILKSKKSILILTGIIMLAVTCLVCSNFVNATATPYVQVSRINNCNEGDTLTFTVTVSGSNITSIPFNASYVKTVGFTANVNTYSSGNRRYTVVLDNIRGNSTNNYVQISSGAVVANDGISANVYSPSTTSNTFNITRLDSQAPTISIVGQSVSNVTNGGTVTYIVRYTDNFAVTSVNLYKNSIKLNGFTADISISGSGQNQKVVERKITLSNIQGSDGYKSISIVAATGGDASGNRTPSATSKSFILTNRVSTNENLPQTPNENVDNNSNETTPNEENNQNKQENNNSKPSDWVPNPNTGKY